MKKMIVFWLFAVMCVSVFAEDSYFLDEPKDEKYSWREIPKKGDITILFAFATFNDDKYKNVKMEIDSSFPFDDGINTMPLMFTMPNGQQIEDYVSANGPVSLYDLTEQAIPDFFSDMTRGSLNITVEILKNPEREDGLWEIKNEELYKYYSSFMHINSVLKIMTSDLEYVINEYYKNNPDDSFSSFTDYEDVAFLFTNFMNSSGDIFSGSGTGGDLQTNYGTRFSVGQFGYDFNNSLKLTAHELGHQLMSIDDIYDLEFNGKLGDKLMGYALSLTSVYDLMSGGAPSTTPYSLYGMPPFHTWQMIHQTYLDSADYVFADKPDEESGFVNNKLMQRIKATRTLLDPFDKAKGIKSGIILPVDTDLIEDGENYDINSMVEKQQFMIELRSGKEYDEISSYDLEGECRGIQISHIMNSEFVDDYEYPYKEYRPFLDVESATPFPEFVEGTDDEPYRDPLLNFPKINNSVGMFYNGREVNDWMDDITNHYSVEGGLSAWWRDPYCNQHHKVGSLPGDFFNDTDRNMFTPTTRPNSTSWKLEDTHYAVFIDNIDYAEDGYDYADITVYRNYWSIPVTAQNAKKLPDGKDGVQISGYGYIGENFSISGDLNLVLGNGTDNAVIKLLPETDMRVMGGVYTLLFDNSTVHAEDSKLTFESLSKFQPFNAANFELDNSELIFQEGVIYNPSELSVAYNFNVTGTGQSILDCHLLELTGESSLILEENSSLTIKSGSRLVISPETNIVIKQGAKLVLEPGVVLEGSGWDMIFENGSSMIADQVTFSGASTVVSGTLKRCIVTNCEFINCGTAIYLESVSYSSDWNPDVSAKITGNSFTNCSSGLVVYDSYNTELDSEIIGAKENSFVGCGTGIALFYSQNFPVLSNNFMNCINGIKSTISVCPIENNYITGASTGILMERASGLVKNNVIENSDKGLGIVSCSPTVLENNIKNNLYSGLKLAGYNAFPILVNPDGISDVNNNIIGNGIGGIGMEDGAQIVITKQSNIYLGDVSIGEEFGGYNNIYYEKLPDNASVIQLKVPCIRTYGGEDDDGDIILSKSKLQIMAEMNYWGANSVSQGFFSISNDYNIDYLPYSSAEFPNNGTLIVGPPPGVGQTGRRQAAKLLRDALILESSSDYVEAEVTYKSIIMEYPDTPESYIALGKLPVISRMTGSDTETLLSSYSEKLNDSKKWKNKQFIESAVVSIYLRNERYDNAIILSEEMKLKTTSEEVIEAIETDISIARMLKELNGKKKNSGNRDVVLNYYNQKTENSNSVLGAEEIIPEFTELFQNYPNPFNPVTQIKFALAKTVDVKLSIYNISGQLVSHLASGTMNAGVHAVDFNGSRLNSGVYYYTLEVDGKAMTKRMVLTK
jgi:nitrous oxidase accessory protein NosD